MAFGFGKKNTVQGEEVTPPSPVYDEKTGIQVASDEKSTGSGGAPTGLRSEEERNRELRFLRKLHRWDPNMPQDAQQGIDRAVDAHDAAAELELIDLIENDSPYPEVRAAVRNYDEDLPCNTVRAWVIGMLLVTIGAAMNMLFSLRSPSISITAFVAQLVAYPIGLLWDIVVPARWRNGPFNYKEHALITIMANVSFSGGGVAYSTDTIVAIKAYYQFDYGWGWQLLVTFGTQMIGFGMAGMLRKFLVYPSSMIWPSNFVNTSLFYALHDHSGTDPAKANGWSIGRFKYFFIVFVASFVWYWFPGWIFQALSYTAFATWIAPSNIVVNQIFGFNTGLGLIPLTFDWTQITGFNLSPLMYPWHAIANITGGVVIWYILLAIILHYTGWAYADYLPMSTGGSFDNTGDAYHVKKILTPEYTFDPVKYANYSPLFLSTTFAISYGLSFAGILAVISHTILFHGEEIWTRAKLSLGEEPDVHTKMMRKYRDVPQWWYIILSAIVLGISLASVLAYPTHLSWWAFFIALIISVVFVIPIGMIQAITNYQIGLNVITEFIIGYMQPGRPLAMMLFKTYGYITMTQALTFAQDMKLGLYMKVPPRTMFFGQVIATIWTCIVQIAVLNWAFGAINGLCDPLNESHFTCPGGHVFFTASIIWGLIGPARIFGPGQVYGSLLWFFLAGLLAPPMMYLLARMFPRSQIRYINMPLIFSGGGNIPPATTLNYTSWGIVGFIFNKVIKNKYRGWWSHYNYLTSAGLDTGLAISTILIFLTLQLTNQNFPNWWGNNVIFNTMDYNGTAIKTVLADGQTFGPATWS